MDVPVYLLIFCSSGMTVLSAAFDLKMAARLRDATGSEVERHADSSIYAASEKIDGPGFHILEPHRIRTSETGAFTYVA